MAVLSSDALLGLSKKEKSSSKRVRLLAISLYIECHNRAQVARQLKVARRSVNHWVSEYLAHGLSGLEDKPRLGKPSALSIKQKQQLSQFIDNRTQTDKGGRLTGVHIREYIQAEFGVDYHLSHIYKILAKLGYSWITSRSRHPKQQSGVQDEARFGQQNTTTRLWAKTGTRPRAVRQQQFEYAHLFGAVCPATGETEALLAPYISKDIMRKHLIQISQRTKPGRHAIVVMDGAGWHTNDIAEGIQNMTIMKIPPYSPELNPIEQVWSWLRQHHLANRCFKGYDDIVEACTHAWNDFISSTKRVIKMCSRDWAVVGKL